MDLPRCGLLFLALGLLVAPLASQSTSARFEVASVKRQAQLVLTQAPPPMTSETFYRRGDTVSQLLRFAFGVSDPQLIGGPAWIRTMRFEINAKSPAKASVAQMQEMVRSLLEDRFTLIARKERRDMPYAGIVVARSDGRLDPALQTCDVDTLSDGAQFFKVPRGGRVQYERCGPLSTLASFVTSVLGKIAIDRTDLNGAWAWHVGYLAPEFAQRLPAGVMPEAVDLPTALQEQLGLKLTAMQGPIDMLIIDSIQQPAEN